MKHSGVSLQWRVPPEKGGLLHIARMLALIGLLLFMLSPGQAQLHAGELRDSSPVRPNIVLIIADDLGVQTGSYGDTNATTPNIDQLAREGTQFNAGYVTAASCSPSRGSILTGLYPHQHGMMGLSQFGTQRMHDDVPKLPNELQRAGYRTGFIGKTHFQPEEQFLWDLRVVNPREIMFDRDVLWMNRRAMDFVDAVGESQPFFLVMSYVDPHRGHSDDGERYGPGRNQKFPRVKLGLPEQATSPEEITPLPFLGLDSPEIREELADFYGAVDRLDIAIGDLRGGLEERGLWDKTVVLLVGDHGPDLTRGKMSVYEPAVHIPFLLKVPGAPEGIVREELVSTIDIMPTLLEIAGDDGFVDHQGYSLLPLTGNLMPESWRGYLFTEFITHAPQHFFPRYAVRDEQFKLILNVLADEQGNPLGPGSHCNAWWESRKPEYDGTLIREVYDRVANPPVVELYDLRNDPYEWENLADNPEYGAVRVRLLQAIESWRQSTGDPLLDPAGFLAEQRKSSPVEEAVVMTSFWDRLIAWLFNR